MDWTSAVKLRHNGYIMVIVTALLALLTPGLAHGGEVEHVSLQGDRLTIRFDDVVQDARSFSLSGPDRIAIDVRGATTDQKRYSGRDTVRTIRAAQYQPDTARIVLDLDAPMAVQSGYFSSNGRQLHLSLARSGSLGGNAGKFAGPKSFTPPAGFATRPVRKPYSVKVDLPATKSQIGLPEVRGPRSGDRPLVVIDAGHGGHDPGAISPHDGKREKDITLAIARSIRDRLLETGRFRVALTRDTDKFLVLGERYSIARRLDADLFISIHADAAGNEEARGATVYTLSEVASDREAEKLAARENKADIIRGLDLRRTPESISPILIDLRQRETMNLSADFAKLLLREGQGKIRFRSHSHRFASFVVLKAPDVPSILLETGYLTNADDVKLLASKAGRTQIADSVAGAVRVYFARQLAMR
ncbi:N-acetylmuramoyl-L-alanine amidase [Alterisphingorhabdus coralli]|uniref:N-acetylmuramoyl-L-alanine amidase n=1 Tax=Alterisphingorhabdus coralli TaxID=3071408 RepID=A0AA97FAH6_9SPHN|nr:N-acetylmuramoyl-L-alanine amidase [Parasphingorhabdus sp. SCSIO 66989]WOE76267.1 N-acetylmuramoyl-L-alanine amidase [Parasphingorhabdus sp. SCSIO 66989]